MVMQERASRATERMSVSTLLGTPPQDINKPGAVAFEKSGEKVPKADDPNAVGNTKEQIPVRG